MKPKDGFSVPAVGAGSLLATFAVLCLTVFALMSLTTVQAEKRLADVAVQAVESYYAADLQAEEVFARLRSGEIPAEVTQKETVYTYQCPISDHQYLLVELEQTESGWQVLCWQAVTRETAGKEETLPVWNGAEKEEVTP